MQSCPAFAVRGNAPVASCGLTVSAYLTGVYHNCGQGFAPCITNFQVSWPSLFGAFIPREFQPFGVRRACVYLFRHRSYWLLKHLKIVWWKGAYTAIPASRTAPPFFRCPLPAWVGVGWGRLTCPAPAAPPRRGRLDIVPWRGLLAYTLYALICTIPRPLLLVSVELLNKIKILFQNKSLKTLIYQRMYIMQPCEYVDCAA